MSLISRIQNDKEFQLILKEYLPRKEDFTTSSTGYPAFSHKYSILVPYTLSDRQYAAIVGTTFDYMARFIMAKQLNKTGKMVLENLVAELGLIKIKYFETLFMNSKKPIYPKLKQKFNTCMHNINIFLKTKQANYLSIIPDSYFLAKIESIGRSGGMPPMDGYESLLNPIIDEIAVDVKKLSDVYYDVFINKEIVRRDSNVVFNPRFGDLSFACGGADADVFADAVLYDFKTSKMLGYRCNEIAQIYGYYLLDCLEKISLENATATLGELKIQKIAFYRARYGIIESFNVNLLQKDSLASTLIKLKDYLYRDTLEKKPFYSNLIRKAKPNQSVEKKLMLIQNLSNESISKWVGSN